MSESHLGLPEVDHRLCDREPIHLTGGIQPHGALLVLDFETLTVLQASENCGDILGTDVADVLGQDIVQLAPEAEQAALREGIQWAAREALNPLRLHLISPTGMRPFDGVVHANPAGIVLELEPAEAERDVSPIGRAIDPYFRLVQQTLGKFTREADLDQLCRSVAEQIAAFTGFDRVMVYRFHPDGHGEVIAEQVSEGTESYLGLHYPASDIPEPARRLFAVNPLRLIVDVSQSPSALLPSVSPRSGGPLDLSRSMLRSVPEVHAQYLRNMGVAASMSISLTHGQRLWGLIACHHRTPRFVRYATRAACTMFATVVSAQIVNKEETAQERNLAQRRRSLTKLVQSIARNPDLLQGLWEARETLLTLVKAGGGAFCHGGHWTVWGQTPPRESLAGWLPELEQKMTGGVFITDHLAEWLPEARPHASTAAGALCLALGEEDYLLLFRGEIVRQVRWAGDPHHAAVPNAALPGGLGPRQSFAAWREEFRGRSAAFDEIDRIVVGELRTSLMLFVMRRNEELRDLNAELSSRNEELEQFVYTVSHDLKSPLVTIKGFVGLLAEELAHGDQEGVHDALRRINRGAEKMSSLIDDLLALSRVGRKQRDTAQIDVNELVADLIDLNRGMLDQGGATVRVQANLPPVEADRPGLERALQNYLTNAVKYGGGDGPPVIELGGHRRRGSVFYYVRDHGPGIAPEYHARIFRLFFRLHGGGEGTGVGLALVAKIAQTHGGRAWVESEPGHGATFWLQLPIRRRFADRPLTGQTPENASELVPGPDATDLRSADSLRDAP